MKGKSILGLVLTLLATAAIIYIAIVGIGDQQVAGIKSINQGLDLAGGVSITYTTEDANPSDQDIKDTIYKLVKRLDEKGYTEGEVYKEGSSRINVDIPGATNADEVLAELGKPGNVEFIDDAGNVVIDGADIKTATATNTPSNLQSPYNVSLELNETGTTKFAAGTKANIGKPIHIVYNGETIMSPTVQTEITDGNAEISHLSTMIEAGDLASTIRIGALPLKLTELRSNVVGAKLGQDAIQTSMLAGVIGILLIFAFMMIYYRLPGLAANLGLALYTGLLICCLSLFNITLTLPGIAGILLSVGMAVDANVIIFARIREELAMEKTIRASISGGFKKAFSAIFDGNITTILAAGVLWIFGTGTIKGFATTLALGIMISFFTALVVVRIIMFGFVAIGLKQKFLYGVASVRKPLPFVEKRYIFFGISIVVIAAGLIMLPVNYLKDGSPLKYDIEFAGGTSTLVSMGEGKGYTTYEEAEADLLKLVQDATGDMVPQFQNVKGKDQVIIKTTTLDIPTRIAFGKALTEKYGIDNASIESQSISGTVSNEMKRDAIMSIILASVGILLYVAFRFKDFKLGVSAIISLLHDILIMFAVYSIFQIPINNMFIAAILTILGYSINDTIVVFDRIRENQKHMKRGDYKNMINSSITTTLSRSINTSMTVFIITLVLYVVGVDAMRQFTFPLLVGIVSGTYSSICNAAPIWYMFKRKEEKTIQTAREIVK